MLDRGSITRWLGAVKSGDAQALQGLWERYFQRLVGLARKKLREAPRRVADEEDVALNAFDSFYRGAEQGRFPRLEDRDDVWQILVLLTARKAADQIQHERRQKRGGGNVLASDTPALEEVLGGDPTPEFAAMVAEECQQRLDELGDDELRQVALWKMEGYTNEEIADLLGCVARSVRRKVQVIQSIWGGGPPESEGNAE